MTFPKAPFPLWLERYKLISKIGSGGMSEVYRARLYGPGGYEKEVAIKLLLPHLSREQEFLKMLMDEARIASLLDHPNIVHIFEFGEFENIYYIAMEYVEGYDLRNILKIKGKLPEEIAVFVLIETLKAIEYAHSLKDKNGVPMKIVHRDISPQNILVRKDGIVKLTDFGIAKARGRLTTTRTGFIKGKISYMAPEQIEGKGVDGRSDLFSLALIIVEILTGEKVFDGETEGAILNSIRNVDPSKIAEKLEKKEWIEELIKCLYRDPQFRPSSAGVLKEKIMKIALDIYIKGEKSLKDLIANVYKPEEVVEEKVDVVKGGATKTKRIVGLKKRILYFFFPIFALVLILFTGHFFRRTKEEMRPAEVFPNETTVPFESQLIEKDEEKQSKEVQIQKKGFLSINTIPWTRVIMDGKEVGSTPLLNMEVVVGKHHLKLINERFGIDETIEVDIFPNKTTKVFKKLRKKLQ